METRLVFLLDIVGIFLAFGVLAGLYVWPQLRALPSSEALKILALPHMFRFIGLSFLFPGVVSPLLPSTASIPAAWGDVGAAFYLPTLVVPPLLIVHAMAFMLLVRPRVP